MRGVDKDNYYRAQYGPQPLEHGLMTKRQLLTYAVVTGLLALACGLILVALRGPLALLLLGLGAFFVLFYTWPLKYIGLGEIAVLIVWGPLMIGGGYFVVTGAWSWNAVLAGLPYALGVTTVIFGKHIDKHDDDQAKGIHTLPVIIGERPARYIGIALMVLMYALVVYLILTGYFIWIMLIVFLAGFCLLGLQFGLNATSAILYPTAIRSNGSGWAFGKSRPWSFPSRNRGACGFRSRDPLPGPWDWRSPSAGSRMWR